MLATAAALALTSCATFSSDAARVGDVELDGDTFAAIVSELAENPAFEPIVTGSSSVDAEFVRSLLSQWIRGQVLANELAEQGIAITDAVRQKVEQQLAADNGELWSAAPDALKALLIESFAAADAFATSLAPDPETLRASYDAGIAASGLACTRHILVGTEDEAFEVLAELRAGADFAELAAQRSLDQGSALSGGIIEPAPGAGCFDAAVFGQALVPEFVEAALAATVGEPTEPVQSQFGWHVILVRPFDDVAEDVAQAAGGGDVALRTSELAAAADVHVASKYGRFDAVQGAVVPLGS